MIRLNFICHGNICRSPMAESVAAYLIRERGLESKISVVSAAAHSDEIGNPPHWGTRSKLAEKGIPLVPHRAVLLTRSDGSKYDYFLCMDEQNLHDVRRILGTQFDQKIYLLLAKSRRVRAIADPWYTGDFEATFSDVWEGCSDWISYLSQLLD